jgi:hypothetical protein
MVEQINGRWPDERGLYLAEVHPIYGPQYMTGEAYKAYAEREAAAGAAYLAGETVDVVLERGAAESREQAREREQQAALERGRLATQEANRVAALLAQKETARERFIADSGGTEYAHMPAFEREWAGFLAKLAIVESENA